LIATYLTMKFFIPKFHYIGGASIYAVREIYSLREEMIYIFSQL